MEDLEALRSLFSRGRRDGAQDPGVRAGELFEQVADLGLGPAGVLGQVGDGVGDLGSGRRHELVEERSRRVLFLRVEAVQGGVEVGAHDLLGAAELGQGRDAHGRRAACRLRAMTSCR